LKGGVEGRGARGRKCESRKQKAESRKGTGGVEGRGARGEG
jgi:hypothetical protein